MPTTSPQLDRRGLFRLGGLTVSIAALVAACGGEDTQLGRVGEAPTTTALPTANVDDATLLRTISSIEHSVIDLYAKLDQDANLLAAEHKALIEHLTSDHNVAATDFEKATTAAGGTAWKCSNPRLDSTVIEPVLRRITDGVPATRDAKAVPPSDGARRDVLNLAHGLETMSSAMYQQMVETLSSGELRGLAIKHGVLAARRAALLALRINPERPGGYVAAAAAAPESAPASSTTTTVQNIAAPTTAAGAAEAPAATPIPPVSAIPSHFGQLAAQFLVVGAGDENGVRLRVALETPSSNTFVYDYMKPSC